MAQALQEAWQAFHAGEFPRAIKLGSELGALGATVANKAAAIDSAYSKHSGPQVLRILEAATVRGEEAVGQLPKYPNAHYMLALVLGRYSQRISILRALAEGLAGRVRSHLELTLDLEPRHAEAHVALGLYHAEIINKLGSLAAGFTHNVSSEKALEHFRQASHLAPASPIVQMEHANGLLLLDADRYRSEAHALYERAAAYEPLDAMEALDVQCATRLSAGKTR
jgi:tetratricopeptide (TPR) repeat protein